MKDKFILIFYAVTGVIVHVLKSYADRTDKSMTFREFVSRESINIINALLLSTATILSNDSCDATTSLAIGYSWDSAVRFMTKKIT